jgi:transposase
MWQPYLNVLAAKVGQALHVLDRFHITLHLNQAVDQVRRSESVRLKGRPLAQRLKHMRWQLLRRGSRVRGRARVKLDALVASKLATARAWTLKDCFEYFWQKIARMLRAHETLLLNWFKAQGEISNGPVEGLNNKIRVVTRRSYGFRTYKAMEIALYHTLGKLPEPESAHRFC